MSPYNDLMVVAGKNSAPFRTTTIAIVLCGANISPQTLNTLLQPSPRPAPSTPIPFQ